ncbi:hypothetical protein GALL_480460 [mine drainage metagenome]|uniref:Lipoprotein n=1 Tax=mine drainage metagenome TaxID=410659 RepID=A0A1J5PG08_9ZZZZ
MRILEIVALCAALGGCAGTWQQTTSTSHAGDQFIGKDVNALVAQIGRPTSSKRIDDGQASYVWELAAAADSANDRRIHTGNAGLYGDGYTPGYISDDPRLCTISVITSSEGIVTQLKAEDSNGTGAPAVALGFNGSICAKRLGTKPLT